MGSSLCVHQPQRALQFFVILTLFLRRFPLTTYSKSGSIYAICGSGSDICNSLPGGNYVLKLNPMMGFYLEQTENFTLPEKLYGNCAINSERILTTFNQRQKNTGVLLVGSKGSGKTLLMRKISIDSGLPVIIINSNFTGDDFNSFLSSITQPAIILFDEFEKIYDKSKQEQVLTLLDGTYQSNKLFIITSNDKWKLDNNMRNRPGRIYYMFEFKSLDEAFIREYCNDELKDQSKVNSIVAISNLFSEFNFDMMAALVEEINRYGEDPGELLSILNTKPEYSGSSEYDVFVTIGDIEFQVDRPVKGTPFSEQISLAMYFCWDGQMENSEIVESINEDVDCFSTPAEWYHEMLKNQHIFPGRNNKELLTRVNNVSGKITYDSLYMDLPPQNIVKTDGKNIMYKMENGFTITLIKKERTNSLDYAYAHL